MRKIAKGASNLMLLLVLLMVFSCQQEENVQPKKGSFQFSMSPAINGRTENTGAPSSVLISIKDSNGNFVVENHSLPLISFGQGYVSESIEAATGNYTITQFLVLDENNDVIYATPLENSSLAHLVNDPLPVSFTVSEDNGTLVILQVVPVSEMDTPEDFGYASFAFDIVVPSNQNIEISFAVPPNPNFVTEGYDSVVVTLTSGQVTLRKYLSVISPVEARASISMADLGITGGSDNLWTVNVAAYHESIDEVLYNVHVNEALTSASISLSHATTKLVIKDDFISAHNSSGEYDSYPATWENWAHLTDVAGNFHFIVNNDPCNPKLTYSILKPDATYLLYEKYIYDDGDFIDYNNGQYWEVPVGDYIDENTFADMCPDAITGVLHTDFYFYVYTDIARHSCYLVWLYENTPIDPEARTKSNAKPTGVFKVLTEEEYANLRPMQGRIQLNK